MQLGLHASIGLLVVVVVSPVVDAQYWAEFRGENGKGVSQFENLPVNWSDTSENIDW